MIRALRRQFRRSRRLRNGRLVLMKIARLVADAPHWAAERRRRTAVRPATRDATVSGPLHASTPADEPTTAPTPTDTPTRTLHIAFVTAYARAREMKLARAAADAGHHVTLVTAQRQFEGGDAFAGHRQATGAWEILAALRDVRPDVVHLFVNYNNFEMWPVARFSPAPVIYDPYDCLQGMFERRYQKDGVELACERRLFRMADHVCSRSLEPRYLARRAGYQMRGVTYFPEYCWQPPTVRAPREDASGDLHVVYCGGIWPENRYSAEEYGYAQHLETGRILAAQGIHLHIYPAVARGIADFDDFFAAYLAEDKSNPHFHFHRPLPYNELIDRLRGFDAALHVFGAGIDSNLGRVTATKLHYSTANKLFDYIEAGLPVIIHGGRHQTGIVRHYGTAIRVASLHDVRPAMERALEHPRGSVKGAALADHTARLSQMYRRVADAGARNE